MKEDCQGSGSCASICLPSKTSNVPCVLSDVASLVDSSCLHDRTAGRGGAGTPQVP